MRVRWLSSLLILAALVASHPVLADDALYQKLGGDAGVKKISADAVALYMTDPRLHDYFDNIAQDHLTLRFTDFICVIAGGPCTYKGRDMIASHKGLHIDEHAFLLVVEDLQTAMDNDNVPFWTQNQLLARLAPMEKQIVTR
jgi:hemoglobin